MNETRRRGDGRSRPRCRPDRVLGDWAYDAEHIRHALRARHILPSKRQGHGSCSFFVNFR